ncbi:hypothetical protein A4A58_17925 [Tardiphaga robiniae]|uniref:Uncharacterized protein n=2 Tax=Tardiphaga robiniae TaxID=943830 RepID=A0A163X9U7_9BRAD|nr:hypothetical protein A4A58_17925 [Tardiphaga robiniae]
MMNPPSEIALNQTDPDFALRVVASARPTLPSCDGTICAGPFTADRILAHPALGAGIRRQAQALLALHQASPRATAPFATQQRWLMSQAGLAQYFRNDLAQPGSGVLAERFIAAVLSHGVASRNTAAAFVNEMLKYGVVRYVADSAGRRQRPFEPASATLSMLLYWLAAHLVTLDGFDGGARAVALDRRPSLLGVIHPAIADGLLASHSIRQPDGTFALFTWVDDGGVVMDRLIAGCAEPADDARIRTDVTSVSALAQGLNLSRTQLGRKFAAAEAMGSLGWSGTRGKSAMWVSQAFWRDYHAAQAVKLAIVDAAFAAACADDPSPMHAEPPA